MSLLNSLPENSGIIICGHGSRAKIAEAHLLSLGLSFEISVSLVLNDVGPYFFDRAL